MNTVEEKILRWDFRKIAKRFIVSAVVAVLGCILAVGYVYRSQLSFAVRYARLVEATEEKGVEEQRTEINKLASCSPEVVDILMLDRNNNVTYSAKQSGLVQSPFRLSRMDGEKRYLTNDALDGVVFKYEKGSEFMLASVFNTDFGKVKDEYDEESFFEKGLGDKKVYLLSYLQDKRTSGKVYIINVPSPVTGGALTKKLVAIILLSLFMMYWVLLALWVYHDATKAKLYPLFWGIIVLLTNVAGVIVYQLYKRGNVTCPACGASQSKSHLYCVFCGSKLGESCQNCGSPVGKGDAYCPHCGRKNEVLDK